MYLEIHVGTINSKPGTIVTTVVSKFPISLLRLPNRRYHMNHVLQI